MPKAQLWVLASDRPAHRRKTVTDPATPPPYVDPLIEIEDLIRRREGVNQSVIAGVGMDHYLALLHVAKAAAIINQYGAPDIEPMPKLLKNLDAALQELVNPSP